MTKHEQTLIYLLSFLDEKNAQAVLLQSYIAEEGPLSEEAAMKVRELLKGKK